MVTKAIGAMVPPWPALLLLLPLAGLGLLLAAPDLDARWQNQPSHFWLVLGAALVAVVLGFVTNDAASRRGDARVFLVSLALLASAGFLGLHALSTPGVLAEAGNTGFVIATPLGLLLAAGFAAASATTLEDRRLLTSITDRQHWLRRGLIAVLVLWAIGSVAGISVLDRPAPDEVPTIIRWLAPMGIALYAYAAAGYWQIYRRRGRTLPLAVCVAFVLLAEAMLAVAVSRTWHATWWEWHILMAVAFAAITLSAHRGYQRDRSITNALGGLYLEHTLEQVDRRYSDALGTVLTALQDERALEPVLDDLRDDGFSREELTVLEGSGRELARVDQLLRGYVGSQFAESLRTEPTLGELGGRERDVTIVFADLVGFTTFSEQHAPVDILAMLNAYWTVSVPAVIDAGGMVSGFAGDAVMAVFNALGDQDDHALRAVRGALDLRDATEQLALAHPGWPRFRLGVNSGPAIMGNVGAEAHRSFTAIGDTTNVAARLEGASGPGLVLVGPVTRQLLGDRAVVASSKDLRLKGKAEPIRGYFVDSLRP